MSNSMISTAKTYYQAMQAKNADAMASCLHPSIRFIGPLSVMEGKDMIVGALKNFVLPMFNAMSMRSLCSSDDKVMVSYNLECDEPIGALRIAALLSFKEGFISEMELFFDARPFGSK